MQFIIADELSGPRDDGNAYVVTDRSSSVVFAVKVCLKSTIDSSTKQTKMMPLFHLILSYKSRTSTEEIIQSSILQKEETPIVTNLNFLCITLYVSCVINISGDSKSRATVILDRVFVVYVFLVLLILTLMYVMIGKVVRFIEDQVKLSESVMVDGCTGGGR
ncbi:hypothetical protein L1887_07665 [Cichorium endivia]|nr:hypothetical protein L1887_07665 [Cichorium endivia]